MKLSLILRLLPFHRIKIRTSHPKSAFILPQNIVRSRQTSCKKGSEGPKYKDDPPCGSCILLLLFSTHKRTVARLDRTSELFWLCPWLPLRVDVCMTNVHIFLYIWQSFVRITKKNSYLTIIAYAFGTKYRVRFQLLLARILVSLSI